VTILADDGELPHEIDAEEARNSLAEAGKRLAEANDPEVVASLVAELRRAEVRVAALA
jgi:F0F1-type ATP synthase epsilon subunit